MEPQVSYEILDFRSTMLMQQEYSGQGRYDDDKVPGS